MSCGVGHRHSLDLALLWLWCRPAATAPIRPPAWELPYAAPAALKKKKKETLIQSSLEKQPKILGVPIVAQQVKNLAEEFPSWLNG